MGPVLRASDTNGTLAGGRHTSARFFCCLTTKLHCPLESPSLDFAYQRRELCAALCRCRRRTRRPLSGICSANPTPFPTFFVCRRKKPPMPRKKRLFSLAGERGLSATAHQRF